MSTKRTKSSSVSDKDKSGAQGFLSFIEEGINEPPPVIEKIGTKSTKSEDTKSRKNSLSDSNNGNNNNNSSNNNSEIDKKKSSPNSSPSSSFFSRLRPSNSNNNNNNNNVPTPSSPIQMRNRSASTSASLFSKQKDKSKISKLASPEISERDLEKERKKERERSKSKNASLSKYPIGVSSIHSKTPDQNAFRTESQKLSASPLENLKERLEGGRRRAYSVGSNFFDPATANTTVDEKLLSSSGENNVSEADIQLSTNQSSEVSQDMEVNFKLWYQKMLKQQLISEIKKSSSIEQTKQGFILGEGVLFLRKGVAMVNTSTQTTSEVSTQTILEEEEGCAGYGYNSVSYSAPNSPLSRSTGTRSTSSDIKKKVNISESEKLLRKSASWGASHEQLVNQSNQYVDNKSKNFSKEQDLRKEIQKDRHASKLKRASSFMGKSDSDTQTDVAELLTDYSPVPSPSTRPRRYSLGSYGHKETSSASNFSNLNMMPNDILQNLHIITRLASSNPNISPIELSRLSQLTPPSSPVVSRGRQGSHHAEMKRIPSFQQTNIEDLEKELNKMRHVTNMIQEKVQRLEEERCIAPDPITMLTGGLGFNLHSSLELEELKMSAYNYNHNHHNHNHNHNLNHGVSPNNSSSSYPRPTLNLFSSEQPTKFVTKLNTKKPQTVPFYGFDNFDQSNPIKLIVSNDSAFSKEIHPIEMIGKKPYL